MDPSRFNEVNCYNGMNCFSQWSFPSQYNYGFSSTDPYTEVLSTATDENGPATDPTYTYHLKIINPQKRSDFIVRMWHGQTGKFHSPTALRSKIRESFTNDVPETTDFHIGYFEGNTKNWIVEDKDLMVMYSTFHERKSSKITLWCDKRAPSRDAEPASKKRKTSGGAVAIQSIDSLDADEMESVFNKLKSAHPDMENTKLRLWAKQIIKGRHDDYENPPNIPLITGSPAPTKKKTSNQNMADALTHAATAIVTAINPAPSSPKPQKCTTGAKFSPMSGAKLRRSCLDDLKLLKDLYQDAVLSEDEFTEQKQKILSTLKDIS